jgi:hypothetical protein
LYFYNNLESRRLAKYNAALRLSDKLNFDKNLSFLQSYVDNQLKLGAKSYDKDMAITAE